MYAPTTDSATVIATVARATNAKPAR